MHKNFLFYFLSNIQFSDVVRTPLSRSRRWRSHSYSGGGVGDGSSLSVLMGHYVEKFWCVTQTYMDVEYIPLRRGFWFRENMNITSNS